MKIKLNSLTGLFLSAAAAVLIAGCASSGYKKGDEVASNIQKAADQINALNPQIDKTMAALNKLTSASQGDLAPLFKDYSKELDKLKSQAQDVVAIRKKMAESGDAFLTAWDAQLAQIKNEDLKSRSEARRNEVKNQLTEIKRSYTEAATQFKAFGDELLDLQKYLSVDLTTGGLASIKNTVDKLNKEAGPLKEAVAKVGAQFQALGVSMASSAPAPAPAK
ncbi:MAG: DUF2959 family protein [Verrucomicrobiota bacterium]